MATTIGDAVGVGAVATAAVAGTDVDAGVDKTATLVSARLVCGCGATVTDVVVSVAELMVDNCAIEVDEVDALAGGPTGTEAAVVDCTWGGSSTCAAETEVDVDNNDEEEGDEDDA